MMIKIMMWRIVWSGTMSQLSRNLHDQQAGAHQNNEIEMMRLRIELKNKEIELLEAQQRARPSNSYVSTSDDAGNISSFSVTLRDVNVCCQR